MALDISTNSEIVATTELLTEVGLMKATSTERRRRLTKQGDLANLLKPLYRFLLAEIKKVQVFKYNFQIQFIAEGLLPPNGEKVPVHVLQPAGDIQTGPTVRLCPAYRASCAAIQILTLYQLIKRGVKS